MIKLYNTYSRSLEDFKSISDNLVKIYCCGPTVYNYAHIGNLRPYTFQDVLKRTFRHFGYKVQHVMNITDVGHLTSDGDDGEDKMIKAARDKGMSVWDIAKFFEDAFWKDVDRLNIEKPDTACKATEHIQEMIDMISSLEEKGFTYLAGGNVYFDTSRFPEYGKMALLDKQQLQHGHRVDVDKNKKNHTDFVLWFTKSKFEKQAMTWDSPWGEGYPGWHIECSAMSCKYLSNSFDIHCGGVDHIPIHHTNEIAQSEAANGVKWVNYWLHNEFIVAKDGKMSKSKGTFTTLQTLIDEGFDPLDYRYMLLGAHYRQQVIFSYDSLKSAQSARKSVNSKIKLLGNGAISEKLSKAAQQYLDDFSEHLADDINTPRAIADLWAVLKASDITDEERRALIIKFDSVLGLSLEELWTKTEIDIPDDQIKIIEEKILQRNNARNNKDWANADKIRDELISDGIKLVDGPDGTGWEPING